MTGVGPSRGEIGDLPREIAIFPLAGVLLLPGSRLPLNVFEPRYLALVEDALGSGRRFGMIQPTVPETLSPTDRPPLYEHGCLGRITSFSETEDGRLVITLTGLCRFRVAGAAEDHRGYRRVVADYGPFAADLQAPPPFALDRPRLMALLTAYLATNQMPMNPRVLEDLKDADLVNTLAMICPFSGAEKQALLEAPDAGERAAILVAILELAIVGSRHGDIGGGVRQ